MSEAPKKIWLHEGFWRSGDSSYWTDEDTDPKYKVGNHYIRADIVEELYEALEEVLLAERFSNRPPVTVYQAEEKLDRIKYAVNKAEAALAKARGEQ